MAKDRTVPSMPSFSTQEELEHLLLEGLHSGEPIEATPELWASLKQEADLAFRQHKAELRKAS